MSPTHCLFIPLHVLRSAVRPACHARMVRLPRRPSDVLLQNAWGMQCAALPHFFDTLYPQWIFKHSPFAIGSTSNQRCFRNDHAPFLLPVRLQEDNCPESPAVCHLTTLLPDQKSVCMCELQEGTAVIIATMPDHASKPFMLSQPLWNQ